MGRVAEESQDLRGSDIFRATDNSVGLGSLGPRGVSSTLLLPTEEDKFLVNKFLDSQVG